jgi:hypothetical protein
VDPVDPGSRASAIGFFLDPVDQGSRDGAIRLVRV